MVQLSTPPGVHWDCTHCGSCCRHFELGPVAPETVARLEATNVARHWAPAAGQPWVERRATADGSALFLRRVDDHCVFLRDDGRCAIHVIVGAEAKPWFCRQFPFRIVCDERGQTAAVRPDCAGHCRTFRSGTPVLDGASAAAAVSGARIESALLPDVVAIVPGRGVPRSEWLQCEEALLATLTDVSDEAREPMTLLREQLAQRTRAPVLPSEHHRGLAATRLVLRVLRLVLDRALSAPGGLASQRAFVTRMVRWIAEAEQRVERPLPVMTEDGRAYVRVVLVSFLATRGWRSAGSVAGGLGRLHFADWLCRQLAGRAGEPVTAASWSRCYVAHSRFMNNAVTAAALESAEPAFFEVFRHL